MKPAMKTEEILRRVEAGETLSSIGRELGITGAALSMQLKRAGKKGPGRVRKVPPDNVFRACALIGTTGDLCKLFGVTRATISKHCLRLEFATRSRFDSVTRAMKESASKGVKRDNTISPKERTKLLTWIRRTKTLG